MEDLYYSMLTGSSYEDEDGEAVEIPIIDCEPVFSKKNVKLFFGITGEELKMATSNLVSGKDFVNLRGRTLIEYSRYTGRNYSSYDYVQVYTRSGLLKIASMFPESVNAWGLIAAAFKLVFSNLSQQYSVKFMLESMQQVHQADIQLLERRVAKLEDQSIMTLVPANQVTEQFPDEEDDGVLIDIDRTPVWRDEFGFLHVNSMNRHVIGYYSMIEVAAQLNLYSESMNPHAQLAQDVCRTALKIPYTAEQPDGDTWCTFKYSHYDSGKKHDKDCLRLTEEGMNRVRNWWIEHASEYAFIEKRRHGYNFTKKFSIHPDIPLMEPYKSVVNPAGGMQDDTIIDVEVDFEQKYDEKGRPDYTDLPFYDSRDQNPDGTWKD